MGTATAPFAGPGRIERSGPLHFVRRAFCATIGGAPGSVERKAHWRFANVIPIANMAGAIDVFVFLWLVAPLPKPPNEAAAVVVNAIAFGIAMPITFIICASLSNKAAEPVADWLNSGEPADEAMAHRILRYPAAQTMISFWAWVASAIGFGILNTQYS